MRSNTSVLKRFQGLIGVTTMLALSVFLLPGCGGGTGTATTGSFTGQLSGSIAASRTTRDSLTTSTGTAQLLPTDFDATVAQVFFEDLNGNPLLDANGQPFPTFTVTQAGDFIANNLPLGVNFVVAVDLDGDGFVDISNMVEIPINATRTGGEITDVVVDPLTTLVVAELRELFIENGIDPSALGVSLTAIVERIIDSYTHLYEETGVDLSITTDDLNGTTSAADLFDTLIPETVQVGMDTAGGSMALDNATDLNSVVLAAAEIFLRAGFPIKDEVGGVDLSSLGLLNNVVTRTFADLVPMDPIILAKTRETAQQVILAEPIIYVSTIGEPDRNFGLQEDLNPDGEAHYLPIIREEFLTKMAVLHLENRTITIRNLHRLLTDIDVGFGARITYFPPFHEGFTGGIIFETADGTGIELNIDQLLADFFNTGLFDENVDSTSLATELQNIRTAMRNLLSGTKAPTVAQLFGAILSDRINNVDELFSFIRKARIHQPFNPSGGSSFYVVADGNVFGTAGSIVEPVSVDVEFDTFGTPTRVTYNIGNNGVYFLSFAGPSDFFVELLVRDTGRFVQGFNGNPIILDMNDIAIFDPINGLPFANFIAESGSFFPGVPLSMPNPDYRLGDETTLGIGPTIELFVLADSNGPDATPIRVDFDLTSGAFTTSATGRYYMLFREETETADQFGLYDVELNLFVTNADLTADFLVDSSTTTSIDPIIKRRLNQGSLSGKGRFSNAHFDDPATGQTVTADPTLFEPALVGVFEITNAIIDRVPFEFVYGTEVGNLNFNDDANPFFDDTNNNGVEDLGEFTADFRPILFNPGDWRSTDIGRYYRRADGLSVIIDEVDFASVDPRTIDGVALVARNYLPRLNAFRFGRPNTAITLLTTFMPASFVSGTGSFTADTPLSIFQAMAMMNLIMEQRHNIEATIDIDGATGPLLPKSILIEAELFVLPLGDPFLLMIDGFDTLSTPIQ